MRLQVLGPLRTWDRGAWSPVPAAQLRHVLALLVAEAGQVVTVDRLVDEIWAGRPPRTAVNMVQAHVMRLRRLLGEDSLVTRGRGYELVFGDEDVDARVFERRLAAGRSRLAAGAVDAAVARFAAGLDLWRGPVLADVPQTPTVAAYVARLEQLRLGAVEDHLAARLDLGRHAEVAEELPALVERHPLRERLAAALMLALYRCGRRAEALEVYRRTRALLVDELGVEPGPDLRTLHRAVLADDPALAPPAPESGAGNAPAEAPPGPAGYPDRERPTPAQLPPDVAGFTGRADHLARLDALLPAGADTGGGVVVAAVTGPAGAGKTALAVRWAHRVRAAFPDGQLYVNLRGYAAGPPLRPEQALSGFLRALGVPTKEVPPELDDAVALYRSLLADRRVLVLLDNANHPDQVRPLLPGSPGCLVLITSRDRLRGLVARDGARPLALGPLTPADADALLVRLLGDGTGDEVGELARLCGYLPLALRIAAANLVTHPGRTVASVAARLAGDDRLAALEVDGDPQAAVRAAFDQSYSGLPADARRLFRLLGLVPGPDVTLPAVAALAGVPAADVAAPLDRLTAGHLVDEHRPGRYALHDLLRVYAADRAAAREPGPERHAALDRLYDHYLRAADAAARRLYPQLARLPMPAAGTGAITFDDDAGASAWLDAERHNVVAAVQHAAERGPRPAAWRLADALRGYLYLRMHTADWAAVARAGLVAAEADGELFAQAAAHLSLAMLHSVQDRYQEAIDHYRPALALARQAGWTGGESAALANLGAIHDELGQLGASVEFYTQALALDREIGGPARQALDLDNLGLVCIRQGRLGLAADRHAEALALYRQAGSRSGEARTLANLGHVRHALGRLDDAIAALTEALALHREVGDRHSEPDTTRVLAAVQRDAGRPAEALRLAESAVTLARETGDRRVEADALTTRASVHLDLGEHRRAVRGHRQALDLARQIGNRYTGTLATIGLAAAYHRAGEVERAGRLAREALDAARECGYRVLEGQALTTLATIHLDRDPPERAIEYAEAALAPHRETGHRLGQARTHLIADRALHRVGRAGEARAHRRRAEALLALNGSPGTMIGGMGADAQ